MKGALLTALVTVAGMAGLIALFAWTPWDDEQRERELAWIDALAAWADSSSPSACARRFDEQVGRPPTQRLAAAAKAARAGCGQLGDPQFVRWEVSGHVIDGHRRAAEATYEADLSRIAAGTAGRRALVHCWTEEDWAPMAEQHSRLYGGDFWAAGLASPPSRIDLAPDVCEPLERFFRDGYSPWLSTETLDLSTALVVLAHEAEHLRSPEASEAEVECHALQRVRGIVRDAKRGPTYRAEMALLAWDLGYPNLPPEYQTEQCRDGGPLDLDPESNAWP